MLCQADETIVAVWKVIQSALGVRMVEFSSKTGEIAL